MYAQLLTRSSTGAVSARTPLLSWAIRFSWSQRSLAENTTSSAVIVAVVGDVKEVAVFLEQPQLALVDLDPLAKDDHPITLLAGGRPIVELRDHLLEQVDVLVPALADDLRLESLGLLTRWRF